jgi:hypothetical protein
MITCRAKVGFYFGFRNCDYGFVGYDNGLINSRAGLSSNKYLLRPFPAKTINQIIQRRQYEATTYQQGYPQRCNGFIGTFLLDQREVSTIFKQHNVWVVTIGNGN